MASSSTSQPIALRPNNNAAPDYRMHDPNGSFPASSSGPFNPASYTRQFIGSPISWRNGSFGMSGISSSAHGHPASWGTRFPIGSPTHRLLSSFESGSVDGDRESIQNALNIFDREGELVSRTDTSPDTHLNPVSQCRNYHCCSLQLDDLHALLEHFEEVHIMVLDRDPQNPQAMIGVPFHPRVVEITPQQQLQQQERKRQQHLFAPHKHQQAANPFDPEDMELELDLDSSAPLQPLPSAPPPSAAQSASSHSSPSSGAPSPPDTPISTPLSAYPSPHAFVPSHLPNGHLSPYVSQPSSPGTGTAASTRQSSPTGTSSSSSNLRPNLNVNLAYHQRSHLSSPSILAHPEDAFNSYARFASDYSSGLPGAQYNGACVDEASALTWQQVQALQQQQPQQQPQQGQPQNGCLPPALLFSTSCTPAGTPGGSRAPSPVLHSSQMPNTSPPTTSSPLNKSHTPGSPQRATTHSAPNSAASSSSQNPSAPANILRPAASLLLSKPFRCPKPNCNKSYKQANGLKYHMTHGSCNFAPPKDLEHVKDLLERKRREREAQGLIATPQGASSLNRSLSVGSNGTVGGLPSTLDTALLSSYYDLNLQSMNITETELREVEREAEKRLRPFACGVGDCQRRYKNMNGLRYHYQHSGDHGAVGLALLASGQHECLQNNQSAKRREAQAQQQAAAAAAQAQQNAGYNSGNNSPSSSSCAYPTTVFAMDDEREGRKRFATTAFGHGRHGNGTASMPVSRAGSTSRTRTPIPISVPVSANNSPKGASATVLGHTNTSPPPSSMNAMSTTAMGGSSSLSNALGMTTGATTSPLTTPLQVVPVHVVNGVGINTGLPPSPPSSASASPEQAQAQLTASPTMQQQPAAAGATTAHMQMAAAQVYHQYAQQYQRHYQAALQMHAAQQQQQQQVQSAPTSPRPGQQPGSPQQYAAYGAQQQPQQQDWMAMDMS
ncbi:hypothetical protein MD484_g7145, partial [Candolleomyces efflorescens]